MDANIGIFDAAVTAVVGYAVVFLGLAILMWLVILLGRIMQRRALPRETVGVIPAAPAPAAPTAPGSSQNTWLYVGIGAVALFAIAGVVLVILKKKKSPAGETK